MLTSGSRGSAVKKLQRDLNIQLEQLDMLAHISAPANSLFDRETLLVVKYLQSVGGLPVDGRVDERTRRFVEEGAAGLDVLSLGSEGMQVRAVQRTLIAMQIEIVADSRFGEFTELGVKRYQQRCEVEADGIVAAETWERIVRSRSKMIPCIALLPNPYSVARSAQSETPILNGKL